jgi:hypothetical protein
MPSPPQAEFLRLRSPICFEVSAISSDLDLMCTTPLAEAAAHAGEVKRDALERDVCEWWQEFVVGGLMSLQVA